MDLSAWAASALVPGLLWARCLDDVAVPLVHGSGAEWQVSRSPVFRGAHALDEHSDFGMLLLFLSEDGGKHFHDELTQMHLFTAV